MNQRKSSQSPRHRYIKFVGSILILSLGLVVGSPTIAQLTGDKSLWIHRADLSNPARSAVFLSALQLNWRSNQEPIMGVTPLEMGPDAFEVYLDKRQIKPVQFQRFADSPEGIDVVLAIDISGSVYSQFTLLQDAVKAYVERLRPGKDQVAILTFGTDAKVEEFRLPRGGYSAFTDNIAELQKAISTPPAPERKRKTVLYKAVKDAIEVVERGRSNQTKSAEKAIIILSDGQDEGTGYDINVPIAAAKKSQIPIFSLGLPDTRSNNRYHDVLDRISRESGGVFVPIRDVNQLKAVYEKIDTLLKNQYVLTFEVPSELQDGKEHSLQVLGSHEGAALSAQLDVRTATQSALGKPGPTASVPSSASTLEKETWKEWLARYRVLSWSVAAILLVGIGVFAWAFWRYWQNRKRLREMEEDDMLDSI